MQSSKNSLARIKTSGFENYCGFYSCANVISCESDPVRKKSYVNIGLNNQTAEDFLLDQFYTFLEGYNTVSKKMETLKANQDLALKEILKYKGHVLSSELFGAENQNKVIEAMRNPVQKQQLLDEYCHFLFNERRDMVNGHKFPEAATIASPYSLEQFKELVAIHNKSLNGKGLLDVLDEAVPFKKVDSESQNEATYQPNAVPIFLGQFLQNKWSSVWQKECADDYKQKLGSDMTDSLLRDIGIGANSFISRDGVNFMMNKIIPNSPHEIVLRGAHFTAYVPESKIRERLGEVAGFGAAQSNSQMEQQVNIGSTFSTKPDTHLEQKNTLKEFCKRLLNNQDVMACIESRKKDDQPKTQEDQVSFYNKEGNYFIKIDGNELVLNKATIFTKNIDLQLATVLFLSNEGNIISIAQSRKPSSNFAPNSARGSEASLPSGKER